MPALFMLKSAKKQNWRVYFSASIRIGWRSSSNWRKHRFFERKTCSSSVSTVTCFSWNVTSGKQTSVVAKII